MKLSEKPDNKDLSSLSALLAEHTTPAANKPKPSVRAKTARTPANDNRPARDVLAWPALERLAHRGDYRRAYALRHWRNMLFPNRVEVAQEGEYNPEVVVEVKPSEAALLGAIGWKVIDKERWHVTGEEVNAYQRTEAEVVYRTDSNGNKEVRIGDLLFRNGELIQWGRTKKGAMLKPSEKARGEKGGKSPARSEMAILSYLQLKGAMSPLTARPYFKPMSAEVVIRDVLPQPGTIEARDELRTLGVDGNVPFNQLPFPATLWPDGLVAGAQWIGGVKKPKPTGEISAASGKEPEAVKHIETASHIEMIRRSLRDHATVLDMAITDASARAIGIAMGLAPAYAEKRGPALIDAAIDALIDLDEHAEGQYQPPEQKKAA